jgi:hypothetical protein
MRETMSSICTHLNYVDNMPILSHADVRSVRFGEIWVTVVEPVAQCFIHQHTNLTVLGKN